MTTTKQIKLSTLKHLLAYKEHLINREVFLDMFTKCSKVEITDYTLEDNKLHVDNKMFYYLPPGRLISLENEDDKYLYCIVDIIDRDKYIIELTKFENIRDKIVDINQPFELKRGMIDNYTGNKPVMTTVGRLFFNQICLVNVFGARYKYDNEMFDPGKYEKMLSEDCLIGEITVNQLVEYIDNITFIFGLGDTFLNAITPKLITIDPKIIKERDRLLKKYKDTIKTDPNVAVEIENRLVQMDKDSLKDDPSRFSTSNKTFDVIRKNMFLGVGYSPVFGSSDPNEYNYLTSTLDSGLKVNELPALFNGIRKGGAGRAKETAFGGALSKLLVRIFQTCEVKEDDCQSTDGIVVTITDDNKLMYKYLYGYINKKLTLLTPDILNTLINKSITIRSPMYCKTQDGVCFKCMGYIYEKLELKRLTTEPLLVGSKFMGIAMASMHGTKTSMQDISNLDEYLI